MIANPNLVHTVLRARKQFEALRSFTLESGQEEIERQLRRRKDRASGHRRSTDHSRSPVSTRPGQPSLQDVPEETSAFAIGDDEDSEDDKPTNITPTPSSTSAQDSQAASISSVDGTVTPQLRGMSEKARGKMPAEPSTFSRPASTTTTTSLARSTIPMSGPDLAFIPSPEWVRR